MESDRVCQKKVVAVIAPEVPWRSVHPQTDHATFRPKLSVHPTNRLLWQFTTVTFVHLYDPSTYFLSTPASRWTVCHLWHNVHPPQNALWHHVHPILKQIWTVCHNIFGSICDILPAVCQHVGVLSPDFPQHVCNVQPAFQRSVDVLSHYFLKFVMFCHLLSKLRTFCHRIFSTH